MSFKNIVAITVVVILSGIGLYIWLNYKSWDDSSQAVAPFLLFILLGIAGGILAFMYLLPAIGDAMSGSLYSSGEQITQNENNRAIAKMAQGDYEGAIDEYSKLSEENPEDTHPIWEISRIRLDKLEDPEGAIKNLEAALEDKEWDQEGAAFLMNRLADLHVQTAGDYEGARTLMHQIAEVMPQTRYSANATHRIRELEEEEVKANLEARRREQQLEDGNESQA